MVSLIGATLCDSVKRTTTTSEHLNISNKGYNLIDENTNQFTDITHTECMHLLDH